MQLCYWICTTIFLRQSSGYGCRFLFLRYDTKILIIYTANLVNTVIPSDAYSAIHITDIEAAINYWRERSPSPDGITLCPELRALATVYALMVYHRQDTAAGEGFPPKAMAAWLAWYDTTPDTPCIAICSTSQGDAFCKGCGRTFEEVQHWPAMTPVEKRSTWHRITDEGTAWRFNTYAERAAEGKITA